MSTVGRYDIKTTRAIRHHEIISAWMATLFETFRRRFARSSTTAYRNCYGYNKSNEFFHDDFLPREAFLLLLSNR